MKKRGAPEIKVANFEMNEEAFGYFLNLLEATMDPNKEVESGGM